MVHLNCRIASKCSGAIGDNYSGTTTVYINTRGKQLVDTPNWIASADVGYAQDGFFANLTPHCYSQRATSLLNDEWVPANCTVDASAGYHFDGSLGYLQGATLQIYGMNLLNSRYLGQIRHNGRSQRKAHDRFFKLGRAI